MALRTNRDDSIPTLEVASIGVVDGSGQYTEHAAVVPQKARTVTDGDRAVIIQPEVLPNDGVDERQRQSSSIGSSSEDDPVQQASFDGQGLREPLTEEVTAVTKVPRRASGSSMLRSMAFVEANRTTILILAIGVLLLLLAVGLRFRL
jgi:hypothetical protein